ncbi:AAA family ATPase [Providencia stuartii]|uniref:AAA family ATPase n=1 Tax=Providencia stuartii TaxID=588 RepID=UPI00111E25C7|nr:AAA family ATPase [Providencia stuartii]
MCIITVCNEKGGTGKSSIAQSLSVYLVKQNKSVLLIDADPQKTTSDWASERAESDLPKIPFVEMSGNMHDSLIQMDARFDYVVVDCGGADSKAMRSTLATADIAIIPFRPKRRDLKIAPEMSEITETAQALNSKLKIFSVITQAPTNPNQNYRIENAKSLLKQLGLNPLYNFTRNLNSWDDAEESGSSVLEYKDDKKAADDATSIFVELFEVIKNG